MAPLTAEARGRRLGKLARVPCFDRRGNGFDRRVRYLHRAFPGEDFAMLDPVREFVCFRGENRYPPKFVHARDYLRKVGAAGFASLAVARGVSGAACAQAALCVGVLARHLAWHIQAAVSGRVPSFR